MKEKPVGFRETLALIWAVYRATFPYVITFALAMLLVTWLITSVL